MGKELLKIVIDECLSLKIRAVTEAEELSKLVDQNREHLRKWLPFVDSSLTVNDSADYLKKVLDGFENGDTYDFGIYYNDIQIGSAGYHAIDTKNKNGEIGYWISKEYEGRGIITEVARALIDFGKNHCDLHRIVIRADPRNVRSCSVPKRLSFEMEGTLRHAGIQNGVFIDLELWSILV